MHSIMYLRQFYMAVLLCLITLVVPFPRIAKAYSTTTSSSTTEVPSDTLPVCEFDVPLDPELVCQMQDPEAQDFYSPGQKFCACPPFSECISKEVQHQITLEMGLIFMCFKNPAYADQLHADMTHGLLREEDD